MPNALDGVFIPCVTPFDPAGQVRFDWFERNLSAWNLTGVRGYMVLGSNGEFRSLSDPESIAVVAKAAADGRDKTLIVGVGRESLRGTREFVDSLAGIHGIDFIAVLTPHYFPKAMTDQALFAFYTEVAEASPWPVLVYVAPGYASGVTPSAALIHDLADNPNIAGVKDTSASMTLKYLDAIGRDQDFAVLAGSIATLATCLVHGGTGGVVSVANFLPNECAAAWQAYRDGRTEQALRLIRALRRVSGETSGPHGVAGVKACMNICGFHAGLPRAPLLALDAAARQVIADRLAEFGAAR
ncbi:MAG: dihydrodipicolinate synthase family protein [Bifidobacteriaceae bacterium]|jgi:4-hydroxy-2-oxoglutarate aldolase|nr:dihydrodipicolinate synthase family protein [Bifidobacteriaceae bacterium]